MNINKAIIIGRITQDLELKSLPNGTKILSFSVATNYGYKTKDGEKKEEVTFHNVVSFNNSAENIQKYFVKGQEIYVEGRLTTNSWEDKETGKKMYKTQILLEKFEFGQKPQGGENTPPQQKEKGGNDGLDYYDDNVSPEDIPF